MLEEPENSMENAKKIKVFIASSVELAAERHEIPYILTDLEKQFRHLILDPIMWELDGPAGNTEDRPPR